MDAIKNISINSKKLKLIDSFSKISPEAEKLTIGINKEQNAVDSKKLIFMGTNKENFDFRVFEYLP